MKIDVRWIVVAASPFAAPLAVLILVWWVGFLTGTEARSQVVAELCVLSVILAPIGALFFCITEVKPGQWGYFHLWA